MRELGAGFIAFVIVVVALTALILGGWQAGWWFAKKNADNQYQVNTHSQGYQQAQIEQLRNDIQGYDASDNDAQKAQIKSTFCSIYADLTQKPNDLVQAAGRLGC